MEIKPIGRHHELLSFVVVASLHNVVYSFFYLLHTAMFIKQQRNIEPMQLYEAAKKRVMAGGRG